MTTWNILAVDPGLRTGVAQYNTNYPGSLITDILDPVEVGPWMENWCSAARRDRMHSQCDARPLLVMESFTITMATAKKTVQPWSLELIGVGRFLAHTYDIDFVLQTPKNAKVFAPDDKIREHGWWQPGKEDHARDAVRHLMLALAKRKAL